MNKRLVSIALVLALSSTGCFTMAGTLIGSKVKTAEVEVLPDGTTDTEESNHFLAGFVIGVILDVATMLAVSHVDLRHNCESPCRLY